MKNLTAHEIIELYNLKAHPEGGYYRETYRSAEWINKEALPDRFAGKRSLSTAIYFLLPEGSKSCFHKLKADELWHFYLGGPITLVIIHPNSTLEEVIVGQDILGGQKLQYIVSAGCWFAAYPNPETTWSLMGCTTAPAFDFSDFEMAKRDELVQSYPEAKSWIHRLTKD